MLRNIHVLTSAYTAAHTAGDQQSGTDVLAGLQRMHRSDHAQLTQVTWVECLLDRLEAPMLYSRQDAVDVYLRMAGLHAQWNSNAHCQLI